MDIKNIMAIDVHSHYDYGNEHDRGGDEAHHTELSHIKKMYDSANIQTAFFSTMASVLASEAVCEGNEYNFSLVHDNEWMYQWVVVDPRIDESFAQAKLMLEDDKCVGIKIHPQSHKYTLRELGDRIFSFAQELETVVLMHPESDVNDALSMADKYPKCKLISAHMGSADHVSLVKRSRNDNIYLDTSGVASSRNNITEYAVSQIGSERILFGTDTYASGFQRGRIEYAMISDDDKVNILRENAIRLFKRNLINV